MKRWFILLLIFILLPQTGIGQTKPAADFSKVRISSVSFAEAELGEVLDFLSSKAEELLKRPVNFIIVGGDTRTKTLTLKLNNVPIGTVLKYSCELTGNIAKSVPEGILVGTKTDVMRAQSDWNEAKLVKGRGSAASQLAFIRIPSLELKDTPITAVTEFLQDLMKGIQTGKGQAPRPNFLFINNPQAPVKDITVSLKLKNVSLFSVVQFVSAAAGHEVCYRIDRGAVVFGHPEDLKRAPRPIVSVSPTNYAWLKNKLIAEVNVRDASLEETLQLIRHHAGDNLNVVNNVNISSGTVSLTLRKTSLATLLAYVCEQTNTNYKLEKRAIVFIDGKIRPARKSTASKVTSNSANPETKGKPVFDK